MKDTGGKSRATHTHIGIGAEINESAASQRQTSGCGTASSTLRPRKWYPPLGGQVQPVSCALATCAASRNTAFAIKIGKLLWSLRMGANI